jgi:hypothetical protein
MSLDSSVDENIQILQSLWVEATQDADIAMWLRQKILEYRGMSVRSGRRGHKRSGITFICTQLCASQ